MRKPFKKSTTRQIKQYLKLYKSGISSKEIARRYGRDHSTILYWVRKDGIPAKPYIRHPEDEMRDNLPTTPFQLSDEQKTKIREHCASCRAYIGYDERNYYYRGNFCGRCNYKADLASRQSRTTKGKLDVERLLRTLVENGYHV